MIQMGDGWMSTRERVLQAISIYISKHGYGPSVQDIANMIGVKSKGHVLYHLECLHAEGRIKRDRYVARSIRLTGGA